eukprot:302225_1
MSQSQEQGQRNYRGRGRGRGRSSRRRRFRGGSNNVWRRGGRGGRQQPSILSVAESAERRVRNQFNKQKALIDSTKLEKIFDEFNIRIHFDDKLNFRIWNARIGAAFYFPNALGQGVTPYLDDPEEGDKRITRLIKEWPYFKIWCKQIGERRNSGGKVVRIKATWSDEDEKDMADSGCHSAEEFCLLVLRVEKKLIKAWETENQAFLDNLGKDFNFSFEKRRHDAIGIKKIKVSNLYICPRLRKTRSYNDDDSALKLKKQLLDAYPQYHVTINRTGDMGRFVSNGAILIFTGDISIEQLKNRFRLINGQRIKFEEWNDLGPVNNNEEKEDVSQDDMLAKLRREKIIVGKMKPFSITINNDFDIIMVRYCIEQLGYKINQEKTILSVFGQEAMDWKYSKIDGGYDIRYKQFCDAVKWESGIWKEKLDLQNLQDQHLGGDQEQHLDGDQDDNKDVNMESNISGHDDLGIQIEFITTDVEWMDVLSSMRENDKTITLNIEQFILENGDGEIDAIALYKICHLEKFDEVIIKNNLDSNVYTINGKNVMVNGQEIKVQKNLIN